jgi:phosphotransferase system  glucose/maltose/N-acetylglucosamine-specific IIC component
MNLYRAAILAVGLTFAATVANAQIFLAAAVDVPLMSGLTEVEGLGVVFDKPNGRIVEAYAVGSLTAALVEEYYSASLPQFGWQPQGERLFERQGERLRLTIGGHDGALTVRFDITPRP